MSKLINALFVRWMTSGCCVVEVLGHGGGALNPRWEPLELEDADTAFDGVRGSRRVPLSAAESCGTHLCGAARVVGDDGRLAHHIPAEGDTHYPMTLV